MSNSSNINPDNDQLSKRCEPYKKKESKKTNSTIAAEYDDPLNYVFDSKGKPHQIMYDERRILESINDKYTHSVISGKHVLIRKVYNPVEGESISFEPKNEFKNYFLTQPGIAGLNRGNAWLGWPGKKEKFGGVTFQPATEKLPNNVFNIFSGYRLKPMEGDCQPFIEHVLHGICAGNENSAKHLLGYFAHMLQKPDEKPSWAILMKSMEGTGKGSLMRPFLEILGPYYIYLNSEDQLVQRFNYCVANRLLIFIDEVQINDFKVYNKIKGIISEPTITMEPKRIDVFQVPNRARLVFTSNHDRVLIAGQRERRFLVLKPDTSFIGDKDYFDNYYRWLINNGASHLMHYLLKYDISEFNPYKAPITQGLIEEKLQSMKPVQQWFYEYLENSACDSISTHLPQKIAGRDLAKMYRDWTYYQMHKHINQSSAETQVGYLMKEMRIEKIRSPHNRTRMYLFKSVDEMQSRFAEALGHSRDEIFTEI